MHNTPASTTEPTDASEDAALCLASARKRWYHRAAEVQLFYEAEGRCPRWNSQDVPERILGRWVRSYTRNRHRLDAERRRVIEEAEWLLKGPNHYPIMIALCWKNNLAACDRFLEINRRPPRSNSENQAEAGLGNWIQRHKHSLTVHDRSRFTIRRIKAEDPR